MPRIRPAEERDAPALVGLLAALGYPAGLEAVRGRLERLLPRDDDAVLVAEDEEGRVIGLATLHLLPVLHEETPRGLLTALVVAESARGCGVGRDLVRRVEELARDRGAQRLVVTTANHRLRTHHFYERLGYAWTGRRYARSLAAAPPPA